VVRLTSRRMPNQVSGKTRVKLNRSLPSLLTRNVYL
jgi:hypothetical protein